MDFFEQPHRRYNILTGEWIKVSPHRSKRPWQGQQEQPDLEIRPEHDPTCYLCPGNTRVGGSANPDYTSTYTFTNDFSALLPEVPEESLVEGLFKARSERGICKVLCFSPRHDLTIPRMKISELKNVIDVWAEEYTSLAAIEYINHVQIFENHGAAMGCSNPHPHGQIWAEELLPNIPAQELLQFETYWNEKGRSLLGDYLSAELEKRERLVYENPSFAVLVPFWAVWPFEIIIISKRHIASLPEMKDDERSDLAEAMKHLGIKYDNLFQCDFPYSMGIHQKPTDGGLHPGWHFHMHYTPPLLRSASIKKFMVGYEMFAMPQRDISAEQAAARLRDLPDTHYREDN